jgi:hypothetical protein
MQRRINLKLLLLTLLAFGTSPAGWGAELVPSLADGELSAILRAVNLPPSIRKDLVSGLTNRVVVRIVLSKSRENVAEAVVGIAVKYDLWEETFTVKVNVNDGPATSTTARDVDEVVAMLSNLGLPKLFAADPGWSGAELQLTVELLFDPIEKARMEEIRKWVAENDRVPPPDAASLSSVLPAPRSASSRLFNRIFEQYASGASLAATWKQTVVSKPFKMDDLRHGP